MILKWRLPLSNKVNVEAAGAQSDSDVADSRGENVAGGVVFVDSLLRLRAYLSDLSESSGLNLAQEELYEMIDRVEADHQWAIDSDPDLEARFVEAVDETINNTEQMVAIIGSRFRAVDWSQRSVNQVGGSGTLGRVWRQLK